MATYSPQGGLCVKTIVTVLILLTLLSLNTFAQDYTRWGLPNGAKARLGKGSITEIAYSPDGTRLAVACSIGIWLYDTTTYQEVTLLTGHTAEASSVSFSPDGRTIASGSWDEIRLWDTKTGQHLKTLKGHTGWVYSVSFSPDGHTIASGGGYEDYTIRLWDAITGGHIHTLTGHTWQVYSVSFSPDGHTIASGGDDTIRLWNAVTGAHIRTLTGHTRAVYSVSFSPDGRTIASGGWDEIHLWDAKTGQHLKTLKGHAGWVYSVSFSPDGHTIVSGSWDEIRLWNAVTGAHIHTLTGHTDGVSSVSFSPDGRTIAGGGRYGDEIRLWDAVTGMHIHTLTGHTEAVNSVSFSPDGRTLASGGDDETIRLWDAKTGQHLNTLEGHWSPVNSISFSPKGHIIVSSAASGNDRETTIRLWDAKTGGHIHTLTGHTDGVSSVSFSPDGRTIASGSWDQTIRLWDAVTGAHIHTLTGHTGGVYSVSFSPDGRTLASGGGYEGYTIRLWDVVTGAHIRTLTGHTDWVSSVSFSPDGRTIVSAASGYRETTIRLWDAVTGAHIRTLTGHTGNVHSVVFSPDGRTIVSGSGDDTIRLWDAVTGAHIRTLTGHTHSVSSVSFSPNGHTLASGSWDGTVLLWELMPSADVNTTVSVSPTSVPSPAIGEQLTFSLSIANGENVAGYQATVGFDSSALRYVESANGDYLPTGAFFVPPVVSGNRVTLASTSLSGESHGGGTLATLTFEAIAVKASTLTLSGVVLSDSAGIGSRPPVENGEIMTPTQVKGDVNQDGLIFESQEVDDVGSGTFGWSKGNSNGVVEVGEQIAFTVTVKNTGQVESKNVRGTLTVEDNSIESIIVDGEVDYDDIGVNKVSPAPLLDIDRSFKLKIPSILTSQIATFTLTLTADNGGPWTIPITISIVNPATIGIEFPENLISEEAFNQRSIYFILTAEYPQLTGVSDADVHYKDCTITLHIPQNTQPFIFPIQTQGEETLETALDIGISIAEIAVSAISKSIEFIELFTDLADLIDDLASWETLDLNIELPELHGSGAGRPNKATDFIVLLQLKTMSLASIDITIGQKYRLGDSLGVYEVEEKRTWVFDGVGAAPAASPLALSDYPPFRLLPLEVQQYLFRQSSYSTTASPWGIPDETVIGQNYPNPFNPETWIPYHLAEPADVTLTIYDTKGRTVRQLDLGHQSAGYYTDQSRAAYWDGRNERGESVVSGVYFYHLSAGDYSQTRRMLILK